MKPKINPYAIVQHSAWGYAGDNQFFGGLETRPVTTKRDLVKVEDCSGLLIESYGEAEDFCDWAMYVGAKVEGLTPRADKLGAFALKEVDRLRIYIPSIATLCAWEDYKKEAKT